MRARRIARQQRQHAIVVGHSHAAAAGRRVESENQHRCVRCVRCAECLRHRILVRSTHVSQPTSPSTSAAPRRPNADAGDAAVLRRQAAVSPRAAVLPDGRFLRDVLRGRAGRVARARPDADLALEGLVRHRRADVRRAVSRRRRLHRAAGEEGLSRRDLRAGRGSEEGQGRGQARGGARGLARHADRRRATSMRASRRS